MVSTASVVITIVIIIILIIGVIVTLYLITRYNDTSISDSSKFVNGAKIEIRSLWNGLFLTPYSASGGYGIAASSSLQSDVNAVWIAHQDPATGNYTIQHSILQTYITVNGSVVRLGPVNMATPLVFLNIGGTAARPNPAFVISVVSSGVLLTIDPTVSGGVVIASTNNNLTAFYQIQATGF